MDFIRAFSAGRLAAGVLVVAAGIGATVPAWGQDDADAATVRVEQVSRAQVVEAMRPEQGYDAATTTNSGRFQGQVFLRLARRAHERGDVDALFIDHEDWFHAFLEYAGLAESAAPEFLRLMREYRQDALIDLRENAVVRRVRGGRAPALAVNVRLAFAAPGLTGDEFSYEDTYSEPAVRVHNDSVVSFRLMDLGDQIFIDEIRGSRARPLTGSLGAVFAVIGTAEIRSVRMAIAADGTTVSIARARAALVTVPTSVTTSPWGRAERGVPPAREDLVALEQRLNEPLQIDYIDYDWEPLLSRARVVAGKPLPLEVAFIGNMALRLSDGEHTLYTDFPYRSGASGYMEYPDEAVEEARAGVTIITHEHADHWDARLFRRTGLRLIAHPDITVDVDPERVMEWAPVIDWGNIEVQPIASPHTDAHVSYLVSWAGRRLFFAGDTESTEALLAQRDLDAAFVSPWLLRTLLAEGAEVDAELLVVYHHRDDEDLPRGAGIHVPSRGSHFILR